MGEYIPGNKQSSGMNKLNPSLNSEDSLADGTYSDEAHHRLEMERFSARSSMRFINSTLDEIDDAIMETLRECGKLTGADRVYIYQKKESRDIFICNYEWSNEGIKDLTNTQIELTHETIPWWMDKMSRQETIHIPSTSLLPPEAAAEREIIESQGIKSTLAVPLIRQRKLQGFLGFDCDRFERRWSENDQRVLKMLANTISLALERARFEEKSRFELQFKQLMSDISSRFVNVSGNKLEKAITDSLRDIGTFFLADRAHLFIYSREKELYSVAHKWQRAGTRSTSENLQDFTSKGYPWWFEQVKKGELIRIDNIEKLPDEAEREKQGFRNNNVKSLLCLPILIQEEPYGMLSIERTCRTGEWSKDVVSSFHLLSALISDVLLKNITEEHLQHVSKLQEVMMDLSTSFINIDLNEIEDAIQRSLEDIGRFVDADRVYIFSYNLDRHEVSNTHEWCNEGITPHIGDLQGIPVKVLQNWYDKHIKGEYFIINDVESLPDDTEQKEILARQNIKSVLAFPLLSEGKYIGFVGFDSVRKKHLYTEKEIQILNVFAQMLVNINQREELQQHLIESREEADRANKAKSVFLANMSHEIRTPINGIIGFLDMLRYTSLTSEQYNYIQYAVRSAESLLGIVNDILDLSKVEAGKLEIEETETDLYELVSQSVEILKINSEKKGLPLHVDINDDVPRFVTVDPLRLKQILINLIGNAIKFTEEGEVSFFIKFEQSDKNTGKFLFEVKDTGIGISEEQKNQLFKAFSQGDPSMNRRHGGAGLGLIISEMLANKMESTIELESEPGKGSRFYFTLEKTYRSANKDTFDNKGIGEKKTRTFDPNIKLNPVILIAEDTDLNRMLVRIVISKYFPNATILEALNGEEAVEHYQNENPDLVFMDIQMPVKNGLEAVDEIRELEKKNKKRVPVVALTAGATSDEKQRCLDAGMDYYISKPFRGIQIKKAIELFIPETE
jgi:signal transduction histidine kinase/ActR/RegA family two-component response regulator